jgi:hypothetical protein
MKLLGNVKKGVMGAAPIAAGVVGANIIANKLTMISNPKLRAGALVLMGALLSGKKGLVGGLGTGIMVGGIVKLAGSFVPGIAAIAAGEDGVYDEIAADVLNGQPEADPMNAVLNGTVLNGMPTIAGNYSETFEA